MGIEKNVDQLSLLVDILNRVSGKVREYELWKGLIMYAFRAVTADDFKDICQLITSKQELFLVYPNGTYPLTITQMEELFYTREALTVLVEDGVIIGFANLYNHHPSQFAYIGNVIVDQQQRGRGLGRAIIEHMLVQAFEKLNLSEVRISVFSDNSPALLLYAALDFLPYDIEGRVNPQGERVALIHMKKSCK